MSNNFFSIIIVNYQTANEINNFLNTWIDQKNKNERNWELIIYDNFSHHQQQELKIIESQLNLYDEKIKKNIFILHGQKNYGFGGGNNRAVKNAKGNWLWFLNADTLVSEKSLIEIEKYIEQFSSSLILAPQLFLADGQTPQPFASGNFPKLSKLISQSEKRNQVATSLTKPQKVDWVSGAAMLVKKSAFDKVAGFDEQFFMYFEDIDLCQRITNAFPNSKIYLLPQPKVIHLGGKSIKKNKVRNSYYATSQKKYFYKHEGKIKTLLLLIVRFPYLVYQNFNN